MYPLANWKGARRGYVFGVKTSYNDFHIGTDVSVPIGTRVQATLRGKLNTFVGAEGGKQVTITGRRYSTRYLHLSKFVVGDGNVERGQDIALSGNTGKSTGPHLHYDCWNGRVDLNDRSRLIDPEDFGMTIKVLVISDKVYDFRDVEEDNPFIQITQMQKFLKPEWEDSEETNDKNVVEQTRRVKLNWLDFNVATYGYDIVALVVPEANYERPNTLGYCLRKQRLGNFITVIRDTRAPRGKGTGWRRDNQVAGTLEHEIHHALYHGCTLADKTHENDKGLGFPFINGLKKFKGWELDGQTRLFKRKVNKENQTTQILERDVSNIYYAMYPGLWAKFGFIKEI